MLHIVLIQRKGWVTAMGQHSSFDQTASGTHPGGANKLLGHPPIRIVILEDYLDTALSHISRLQVEPDMSITAVLQYGSELEAVLDQQPVDVLLLDIRVPTSPDDPTPFPSVQNIPNLLEKHATLSILVVTMYDQRALIDAVIKAGADGYVLKDDREANDALPALVRMIAAGGMYISPRVRARWQKLRTGELVPSFSLLELRALSLCAQSPTQRLPQLAEEMNIARPAIRTILWGAYRKLGVGSRQAAVSKARQTGILPPENP